jgi:hypothetical protein
MKPHINRQKTSETHSSITKMASNWIAIKHYLDKINQKKAFFANYLAII